MTSAAFLAAWLGAVPALAADPETPACSPRNLRVLELTLPNILMRELKDIRSIEGRAAVRFLASHPNLPFKVAFEDRERAKRLGRAHLSGPILMSYHPALGRISLAHRLLHESGRDESVFAAERAAQRQLARAVSCSFVHEISHAREQARRPGLPSVVEDELLGSYRCFAFLLDALAADPAFNRLGECVALHRRVAGLFAARAPARELLPLEKPYLDACGAARGSERVYLGFLSRSNAAFEDAVRRSYAGRVDSLAEPADALAHKKKALAAYVEALESVKALGDEPGDDDKSSLRMASEQVAFLEDAARVKDARDHFDRQLALVRADLDARRDAGALKRFEITAAELAYGYRDFEALRR